MQHPYALRPSRGDVFDADDKADPWTALVGSFFTMDIPPYYGPFNRLGLADAKGIVWAEARHELLSGNFDLFDCQVPLPPLISGAP